MMFIIGIEYSIQLKEEEEKIKLLLCKELTYS